MLLKNHFIPKWVGFVALFVVFGQAVALVLLLMGKLSGSARNVLPEMLLGGEAVLLLLGGYLLRFFPRFFSLSPSRLGLIFLTLLALGLSGFYVLKVHRLVTLPYDLASWSETFFISDIIKLRTGAPFYFPAADSNSSTYTPGAPAVTYFLASLFGEATSIPFYRLLQQLYLLLAALLAASASWHLLHLAAPERFARVSRLWLVFFCTCRFFVCDQRTHK